MSYNIIHDDGRNPLLWNNIAVNNSRSNSLYSQSIGTSQLTASSVDASMITTPLLDATTVNSTNYTGDSVTVETIVCSSIKSNLDETGGLSLPPYNINNTLTRYYSLIESNADMFALDPISSLVDIRFELIGKICNIQITPSASAPFINNRKYFVPSNVGVVNFLFPEFGNFISNLLFNILDPLIVIQGSGFYLKSTSPPTRETFYCSMRKTDSIATSFIELSKQNLNEQLVSPAWTTADYIFSVGISFITVN